ncbi:hypothetical protein [Halalkalibacter urbisdiaboli]
MNEFIEEYNNHRYQWGLMKMTRLNTEVIY